MVSIRFASLIVALSLGMTAPAAAGWWQSQSADAGTAAAPHGPPAARKPKPTSGTAVPEPADFALFAAGVVGLLLGRRGSRSRRD